MKIDRRISGANCALDTDVCAVRLSITTSKNKGSMSGSPEIVDQRLAALLANEPDPLETFARGQSMAVALSMMHWHTGIGADHAASIIRDGTLRLLGCGHFVITKNARRAKCPRCGEMIRAGYDYDAFRNLGAPDQFEWPGDPLRVLHEQHDCDDLRRFDPSGPMAQKDEA